MALIEVSGIEYQINSNLQMGNIFIYLCMQHAVKNDMNIRVLIIWTTPR